MKVEDIKEMFKGYERIKIRKVKKFAGRSNICSDTSYNHKTHVRTISLLEDVDLNNKQTMRDIAWVSLGAHPDELVNSSIYLNDSQFIADLKLGLERYYKLELLTK